MALDASVGHSGGPVAWWQMGRSCTWPSVRFMVKGRGICLPTPRIWGKNMKVNISQRTKKYVQCQNIGSNMKPNYPNIRGQKGVKYLVHEWLKYRG